MSVNELEIPGNLTADITARLISEHLTSARSEKTNLNQRLTSFTGQGKVTK